MQHLQCDDTLLTDYVYIYIKYEIKASIVYMMIYTNHYALVNYKQFIKHFIVHTHTHCRLIKRHGESSSLSKTKSLVTSDCMQRRGVPLMEACRAAIHCLLLCSVSAKRGNPPPEREGTLSMKTYCWSERCLGTTSVIPKPCASVPNAISPKGNGSCKRKKHKNIATKHINNDPIQIGLTNAVLISYNDSLLVSRSTSIVACPVGSIFFEISMERIMIVINGKGQHA